MSITSRSIPVFLCAGALPLFASAQQTDEQGMHEVIVTAQKRATNLQDVPFSVASTSEDQMRNTGSDNIVELARNIALDAPYR